MDIEVPEIQLGRKLSVGRHMVNGARTVRFVSNRAWQGVKRLLKLMWDILKIFGLVIAYFVVRNIEVTNKADVNRQEFSL